MAGTTLLQVSWIDGEQEEIKPIAQRMLDETVWLTDEDYVKKSNLDYNTNMEVKDFLESIVSEKSCFKGWKGILWLWGTLGKFTDIKYFLKMIIPFFKELWEKEIILEERRVIIIENYNESHAKIYVISYDENEKEVKVSMPFWDRELRWGV